MSDTVASLVIHMTAPGERTTQEITLPKSPTRPAALIVDDDADTRASLAELFAEAEYQVVTVEDGLKAFEFSTISRRRISWCSTSGYR
jgi:hypothetical protein